MTHSEKDAFLFARIAFVEHKKNTLVRRALVRGLSSRENWAVDDCDLAAEIINTGRRAKLEKQFLAKVDFERRRLWSETRNAILRNHPEFAGRDPGLLTAVARLKAEDGDHEGAIEALERLRGSIQQPEHRREILLQMLDLLPHIDPESYEKYIDSLSPDCFEDLELTTALKELCLNRVLPATEAVTIFRRWEDLLRDVWQEGDQSVSGHTVCDDEGRLLDIYLESRDVGGTRSVLRHASNTENPPRGSWSMSSSTGSSDSTTTRSRSSRQSRTSSSTRRTSAGNSYASTRR